jgi:hypothetical protein
MEYQSWILNVEIAPEHEYTMPHFHYLCLLFEYHQMCQIQWDSIVVLGILNVCMYNFHWQTIPRLFFALVCNGLTALKELEQSYQLYRSVECIIACSAGVSFCFKNDIF